MRCSELATIATKLPDLAVFLAQFRPVKTDDSSNRLLGVESKRDTGAANLQPTYSQRGVESPLLRHEALQLEELSFRLRRVIARLSITSYHSGVENR